MNQKGGKGADSNNESDGNSEEKRIARPHRFKLDREFVANHEISIVLLLLGAIFVSPINDLVDQRTKVWFVGFGVWCFLGVPIALVCKSITASMKSARPDAPPADTRPSGADLHFEARTALRNTGDPLSSYLWITYTATGTPTTYPVSAALFVNCTNQGQSTFKFGGYAVECQSTTGNWETMPSFRVPNQGNLFMLQDYKRASKIEPVGGMLHLTLANKEIAHGETVGGWVYLGAVDQCPPYHLRVRFRDSASNEFVSEIKLPLETDGLAPDWRTVGWRIIETGVDLTGIPVKPYFNPRG